MHRQLLRRCRGVVAINHPGLIPRFAPIKRYVVTSPVLIHTHVVQRQEIAAICEILKRGGKWDSLNANCSAVELTDSIVEDVLVSLKEAVDAKRALVFFHWCAKERRYLHGLRSYCLMIHILVRAGSVTDAKGLMEAAIRKHSEVGTQVSSIVVEMLESTYQIVVPGPQVFDVMLISLSKLRMFDVALNACFYLGEHGFLPSLATFNSFLHVVQKSETFDLVWRIYEHMVANRVYPNKITVEIMVNAICKAGMLQKIMDVLDRIHGKRCSPSVLVSTSLVLRIIEENRGEEVIVLLRRMLQKNLILDDIASSLTIYAYCRTGNLDMALKTLEETTKRGHDANSFVYTELIGLHCVGGRIDDAKHLMQEMLQAGLKPYAETYNYLIEWSSRMGRSEESLAFCTDQLSRGLLPSRVACNEMMSRLCQHDHQVEKADKIFTVLLDKGFVPDEQTYCNLIDGYGRKGNAQEVMKLYYEMEGRGPSPGLAAYTSLIRSLYLCGKLKEAEKMASIMKEKSLATPDYIDLLLVNTEIFHAYRESLSKRHSFIV